MAWLAATPKPDPRSRRGKDPEQQSTLSRLDRMRRDKITPPMPPNPAPHFIMWLLEIGLTQAAGMGVGPISWAEITEWQRNTAVALAPWEARLLRQLSVEYVAESRRAENENCPPPWNAPVTAREIEVELAQLEAVLG